MVRFLAGYKGLLTHWDRGTVPCLGQGQCPPNRHRKGTIWKGYAPCQIWDEHRRVWVPYVLEITEGLEEQLRGRQLRGEVWSICREAKGNGKTGNVIGTFCQQLNPEKLSPAFDVEPVLCRVMHQTSIKLGASNPMPAKLVLEEVADAPPELPADLVPENNEREEAEKRKAAAEQWRQFREQQKRGAAAPGQTSEANGHHQANGSGHQPR